MSQNGDTSPSTLDSSSVSKGESNLMRQVANMGNAATICAGFVMYNVGTFDTDVIRGANELIKLTRTASLLPPNPTFASPVP